ncbi:MAG: hypothetical protein AAFV98_17525 [Chloroflexota bacterium]
MQLAHDIQSPTMTTSLPSNRFETKVLFEITASSMRDIVERLDEFQYAPRIPGKGLVFSSVKKQLPDRASIYFSYEKTERTKYKTNVFEMITGNCQLARNTANGVNATLSMSHKDYINRMILGGVALLVMTIVIGFVETLNPSPFDFPYALTVGLGTFFGLYYIGYAWFTMKQIHKAEQDIIKRFQIAFLPDEV